MPFYVHFVYIISYDNTMIIDYLHVLAYLLFFNILIFDLWILMSEHFRRHLSGFTISWLYKVLSVLCYFFMIKNYLSFFSWKFKLFQRIFLSMLSFMCFFQKLLQDDNGFTIRAIWTYSSKIENHNLHISYTKKLSLRIEDTAKKTE